MINLSKDKNYIVDIHNRYKYSNTRNLICIPQLKQVCLQYLSMNVLIFLQILQST